MLHIDFDPDQPLVATSAFPDGTLAAGETFDWRAKGLQALDALALFQAGLVAHPPANGETAPVVAAATTSTTAKPQARAQRR